jgi:hypothetical protein
VGQIMGQLEQKQISNKLLFGQAGKINRIQPVIKTI